MRKLLITVIVLVTFAVPVLAHDGELHVTELEQWVAGIGILLILMACVYSFVWHKPERGKTPKRHDSGRDDIL